MSVPTEKSGIKERVMNLFFYYLNLFVLDPLYTILDHAQAYYNPIKHNEFLKGNYGPVKNEITSINLAVTRGSIPKDLVGEFVRNGPNPKSIPKGGYHWFDGDGMLHGVRLMPDGTVNYVNRYVRTNSLKEETKSGRRLRVRIGEMFGKLGLLKVMLQILRRKLGIIPVVGGTANTALVFHDRKLQALVESDVPYSIRIMMDGTFETAARLEYDGKLRGMTAHPKVDPKTDELFFFSYTILAEPWLVYGLIDSKGQLVRTMPVSIPKPVMMHDFAITEHYAVFFDLALEFNKERMVDGFPFFFNKNKPTTIGVLDRYAKDASSIKWFSIPPCYVFHTLNAWEEGDEVVIYACKTAYFSLEQLLEFIPNLTEWRCNMKTGQVTERVLFTDTFCEFPRVHPDLTGRKSKYGYCATADAEDAKFKDLNGVVKVDLENQQIIKKCIYGSNKHGGEAVFVPRKDAKSEDDGYLMTFVHDEDQNQSQFWIIDAKTMSDIIAVVNLPQRVPFGFHGIWVSEDDIQSQNKKTK